MTKAVLGACGAVMVVLAAASLSAQTRKNAQQQLAKQQEGVRRRAAQAPGSDASIAARLHRFHRTQIEAARIAEDRGGFEDVRSFSRNMTTDYQINDDRLVQWVAQNELADEVLKQGGEEGGANEDLIRELQTTAPARFDVVFLTETIRLHDKAYELCVRGRTEVANFDLRALLQETMPTLKKYRDTAQRLLDIAEASAPVAQQPPTPPPAAAAARANGASNGNGNGNGDASASGRASNGNGGGNGKAARPSPVEPPTQAGPIESSPSPAPTAQPTPTAGRSDVLADPAAIRSRLVRDPVLADDDVEVTVMEGTVILTGTVDSVVEKNVATDIARRYVGQTLQVDNRLLVAP